MLWSFKTSSKDEWTAQPLFPQHKNNHLNLHPHQALAVRGLLLPAVWRNGPQTLVLQYYSPLKSCVVIWRKVSWLLVLADLKRWERSKKTQTNISIKKTAVCTRGIWKVLKTGFFFPVHWLHSLKEIDLCCGIWIYLPFSLWKCFSAGCCSKVAICDTLRFCNTVTFLVPTCYSSLSTCHSNCLSLLQNSTCFCRLCPRRPLIILSISISIMHL